MENLEFSILDSVLPPKIFFTRPAVIYKNLDPTQSDPWVDLTRKQCGHLWDSCQQLTNLLSHEYVQR